MKIKIDKFNLSITKYLNIFMVDNNNYKDIRIIKIRLHIPDIRKDTIEYEVLFKNLKI